MTTVSVIRYFSGDDDFVVEAASRDDQEDRANDAKCEAVLPEMSDACAAEDDAACDVDVVGRRDQIAERIQESGNCFARKNVPREKDAREDREKSELHSFGLR